MLYPPKQNPGQIERKKVSDSLPPHGILQDKILEWVAFPFSRESSQPRDGTQVSALQTDSLPAEQRNPKQVELPELMVTDHGVCFTCNLFERQVEENSGILRPCSSFLRQRN